MGGFSIERTASSLQLTYVTCPLAYLYYLGSYSSAVGRWKGEMLNQEHTPAKGENPVFGGYEVGIGFSGTCTSDSGELEGIALAGKR